MRKSSKIQCQLFALHLIKLFFVISLYTNDQSANVMISTRFVYTTMLIVIANGNNSLGLPTVTTV